jgi:ribosomal protein S12 methylthiotransferase accessory factor
MNSVASALPADVPEILRVERAQPECSGIEKGERTLHLVQGILAQRQLFGITRLGSITRLDCASIPVVQVVRPRALSNAVSQGKGLSLLQAAASALMETLETWAGERIAAERISVGSARSRGDATRRLFAGSLVHGFDAGWDQLSFPWIEGWDLFTRRTLAVPVPLVDTLYLLPSPYAVAFPRTTTGLAAGASLSAAIIHASLELVERESIAAAERHGRFFEEGQLDARCLDWPLSSEILGRLRAGGLMAGLWLIPSSSGLPVYCAHVIESEGNQEIAPLPGEGFGCDFSHDAALAKALLEACQARVTAIAGAREDITRREYPDAYDRQRLSEWRSKLASPTHAIALPREQEAPSEKAARLDQVLEALQAAGAGAVIVVPLFSARDPDIQVVRVVAPPLRPGEQK